MNTDKNTQWALLDFSTWKSHHNANPVNTTKCPENLLLKTPKPEELLAKFVNETHREDGEAYPPKTLYQMLCALQWYMQKNDPLFSTKEIPVSVIYRGTASGFSTHCMRMVSGQRTKKLCHLTLKKRNSCG